MKGQVGYGVIGLVVGIIAFIMLLPTIKDAISPTYTLASVTNESVVAGASAQLAHYPLDGTTPKVMNTTNVFTAVTDYNITTATGAMDTAGGAILTSPVLVTYQYQPASYQTDSSARLVAATVFIMVLLGLFVLAGHSMGAF